VIAVAVGIYMIGQGVKKGFESLAAEARASQADLKVQKHAMMTKEGERTIVGTLKNISPIHTYGLAFVEFDLSDKSGQPLLPVSTQTKDLKPGATWTFKIPVTDLNAASYKFREVSGFQDRSEDPTLDPEERRRLKAQKAETNRRLQELLKKAQEDTSKQDDTSK